MLSMEEIKHLPHIGLYKVSFGATNASNPTPHVHPYVHGLAYNMYSCGRAIMNLYYPFPGPLLVVSIPPTIVPQAHNVQPTPPPQGKVYAKNNSPILPIKIIRRKR